MLIPKKIDGLGITHLNVKKGAKMIDVNQYL